MKKINEIEFNYSTVNYVKVNYCYAKAKKGHARYVSKGLRVS